MWCKITRYFVQKISLKDILKLFCNVLRHFLFIDIQNFLWTISICFSFDRETVNNTTNSQRESSWQNETKSIGKPQYISPLKLYWIERNGNVYLVTQDDIEVCLVASLTWKEYAFI